MRFSWLRFLLARMLGAAAILGGVGVVTFVVMRLLPGDPAAGLASGPGSGPDEIAALRHKMGLDQPIIEQLGLYIKSLSTGDLGRSFTTGNSVVVDLARRLPASLELTFVALALAAGVGIPLGVAAAVNPGSPLDHASRALAAVGAALPAFVVGLVLIYVFYFRLGWAPEPAGQLDPLLAPPRAITGAALIDAVLAGDSVAAASAMGRLALPAATMALFALAPLIRITRNALMETLSADFIKAARARGLAPRTVLWRYAMKAAAAPILTALGMVFSYMLGANVIVEKLFAWPGISAYALDALTAADYAPVQGFVLTAAALFAAANLTVDILQGLVDPQTMRGD